MRVWQSERVRMRVGLRSCMFGWCCLCILGVGGEDGDNDAEGDICGGYGGDVG